MVTVLERFGKDARHHDLAMFNGQIPHGVQLAEPSMRQEAIVYYSPSTGIARAFKFYGEHGKVAAGTIGLGIGTVASFVRPGDELTFYEINPEVERLAREFFTYLSGCRGQVSVDLGDGRLTLEREPPRGFQVFVLDAFSGDAIPSHLLTKEAFDIYARHMAPDGVIVVHISNKYLDLLPVVRALARQNQMHMARVLTYGDNDLLYRADWVLLSRNADLIETIRTAPEGEVEQTIEVEEYIADSPASGGTAQPRSVLWTDDHSNLFEILR